MIIIVDYGAGNIKSIQNMLKKIGVKSKMSSDKTELLKSDKLIIPGVGHFDYGMQQMKASGLIETLNQKVLDQKTPVLGICLGAQLLGNGSEEGTEAGLGWLDMDVVKFDTNKIDSKFKIPHMGWNEVYYKKESVLTKDINLEQRYYFVHSYHMKNNDENDVLGESTYGYPFTAAVEKNNIFGVQFHPEKSHNFGMKLLSNFAKI